MSEVEDNRGFFSGRGKPYYLRALLAVVLVAFLVACVDSRQVAQALEQVGLLDICILLGLSLVMIAVSVLKWGIFLKHLGIHAKFEKLFGLYLVGYFVNTFTPSFVGGDVVRSLALGKHVNRAHAVSATVLERYTGIVAMLCMAGVAVFFSRVVTQPIAFIVMGSIVGCIAVTALVALGVLQRLVGMLPVPKRVIAVIDSVHEGLMLGGKDPRLVAKALLLSLLFHLLTIVNTLAVAHAIGWIDAPWLGLLVVVPLILLVGAVPVAPQGLGIQEGAFVFFLHSVGATTGQALAVALVLRAKSYLLAVCGAYVWWLRKDVWSKQQEPRIG